MKQDIRLNTIASYAIKDEVIADIGADHGYLTILLFQKGIKKAQVIENKIGPLNNAKNNLKDYDNITYSLSSGLTNLNDDVNSCFICGMGGLNIIQILEEGKNKINKQRFILQPNKNVIELRQYLNDNSFFIIDEDLVKDDDHFYHIMIVFKNDKLMHYNDNEIKYGPVLLKKQSEVFTLLYQKKYDQLKNLLMNDELDELTRNSFIKQMNDIKNNVHGVK